MANIQTRQTKSGETRHKVTIRMKGAPTQTATFKRLTDAKKWARQTEAAIEEGRHFRTSQAKRHTLADLIDRYVRDVLPGNPKAAPKREHQLRWWKEQIGAYTLADVTPALLAEHRDLLARTPTRKGKRANATVVRYLAALSHALGIATDEWGWLEVNPMRKVRKPKEERGRDRYLDDDERSRLLEACEASPSPYLYPVVVLALSTGMRKGEIMGLRWGDVDFDRERITLRETKNGEIRVVPLVGFAGKLLREHAKIRRLDTDLLFPASRTKRPGDPLRPAILQKPWVAALKAAGVDNFRFHDLRHSAASYLAMKGATGPEIAAVLGHKTLAMVKRYAHKSESHTAGVVARMNEGIFGSGS